VYYHKVDFWTIFISALISTIATTIIGLLLGRQFVQYIKRITALYALLPIVIIAVAGLSQILINVGKEDYTAASETSLQTAQTLLNPLQIIKLYLSEFAGILAGIVVTLITKLIKSGIKNRRW